MRSFPVLFFLLFFTLFSVPGVLYARGITLSLDGVQYVEGRYRQRLNYDFPADTTLNLHLLCYRQGDKDSLKIYELDFEQLHFRQGVSFIDLDLSRVGGYRHPDWFPVIERFGLIAPGSYTTDITLGDPDRAYYRQRQLQQVDSALSAGSGLRQRLNKSMLLDAGKNKIRSHKKQDNPDQQALSAAEQKVSRQLRSVKGLDSRPVTRDGVVYSELWYKGFMLGRYELSSVKGLSDRAASEAAALKNNASSKVQNELEDFRSVSSQVRELYGRKQKSSANGFIELNTYHASSADPNSAVAPDYSEVLLQTNAELRGLPISVEAYYTTQDEHRQAKASYFRFHYDVEAAKSKLQSLLSGYKTKMSETISKGQGLDQVYGNYAQNLEEQKGRMLSSMKKDYGLDEEQLQSCNGDIAKLPQVPDTSGLLSKAEDKAQSKTGAGDKAAQLQAKRAAVLERYQRITELAAKIAKYQKLLQQYRDQSRLDSALNYDKVKQLEGKDASYKDMAKAASGLLPEGKVKNFASGLTSFDAGIINKYESSYTMAGQTLKGLSLGYDLGAVHAVVCGGTTEYASREGQVDRYSSVLLRLDSKGIKDHKISLIYNGTTPSKSMMTDSRFTGSKDIAYPGFTNPVHIVSLVYEGQALKKDLQLHTEWAGSFRNGVPMVDGLNRLALNNSMNYHIPGTTITLKGEWEHLGKDFENSTLPYIRSATDRYSAGTGLDLFGSFLSLNVVYNYMLQQNFSSTGASTKWGVDLRTHSKRYPNVSVSYKPFSTFRSYTDTLNIPQRPLLGEVITGRTSYQYKRNKIIHRISLVYTSNHSSGGDSMDYRSSTAQATYTYTQPGAGLQASAGRIELPAGYNSGTGLVSSYIFSVGGNKTVGKNLDLSLMPEWSVCSWGLQRLSVTTGVNYRFEHQPLSIRLLLRCSRYRLQETDAPVNLYAGQLGVNWQFRLPKEAGRDGR